MKNLAYLNKYFWKYKLLFFSGILFIIISNIFGVYSPKMIQLALDLIVESANASDAQLKAGFLPRLIVDLKQDYNLDLQHWFDFSTKSNTNAALIKMAGMLAILYIVVYLLKGVFLYFMRQTLIVMSRYIEYDIKNEVFNQYQKLDTAFYKRNNTGDLMNRISEDVSKVRMYLGPGIMYTINLLVLFVLTVGFMLQVNAELTLYTLAPLPIMSIVIYYVSNSINKKSDEVQQQQSFLSTLAQEAFSGIRVIKAYGREQHFTKNFTSECEHYKQGKLEQVKIDATFFPIIQILIGLSTSIAILVGGYKAINGEISIGSIASFIIYINMLTWPFAAVGWVTSINQQAAASMNRINEFLLQQADIVNESPEKSEIKGKLSFRNVGFTYPDNGVVALKNISFEVNAGETVAIMGRTGAGKSTLASLITRMFDVQSGELLLDDKAVRQHHLYQLRSEIGYVPQEVFLFSDSIANNISFGIKGKVAREEVEQAAKDACIYENITHFKDGFETLLGERGITLSGGQKQRVSIARAIIKAPKILIFDDCLSAVDTETEEHILQNLKRIMEGRTTILISHRISTVKNANQIILLDNGEIIEQGNHQELLDKRGTYYSLYQKQLLESSKLTLGESA